MENLLVLVGLSEAKSCCTAIMQQAYSSMIKRYQNTVLLAEMSVPSFGMMMLEKYHHLFIFFSTDWIVDDCSIRMAFARACSKWKKDRVSERHRSADVHCPIFQTSSSKIMFISENPT